MFLINGKKTFTIAVLPNGYDVFLFTSITIYIKIALHTYYSLLNLYSNLKVCVFIGKSKNIMVICYLQSTNIYSITPVRFKREKSPDKKPRNLIL